MISDEQVRWIALFFLLTLPDEKIALAAAHRAIAQLKTSAGPQGEITRLAIVQSLWKNFEHHHRTHVRHRSRGDKKEAPIVESALLLPTGFDLKAWRRFQRDASQNEVVALTLANILGFSKNEIADGLTISVGTVHYRIGRAARQLGACVETNPTSVNA